jgi:hypothetical protein
MVTLCFRSQQKANTPKLRSMTSSLARLIGLTCASAALLAAPVFSPAQTSNSVSADTRSLQTAPGEKPQKPAKPGPFHGKLVSIDKVAKTIVVGKRTFQITSGTRIKKAGKPATLEDGVVGENVSGYVKPGPDGKLNATTINFGPKPAARPVPKNTTPAEPPAK